MFIQANDTRAAINAEPVRRPFIGLAPDLSKVSILTNRDRDEALSFLNLRPVHTVVMTSFIIDNGMESTLNRGEFYGYRNAEGTLEGVALIGHSTLVEARSDEALKAFAFTAKRSATPINLIMSDGEDALRFWNFFADGPRCPRLTCSELLFEVGFPFLVQDCKWEIRNANMDDLQQVAEAQAEVALIESGVDPMERDREGFLKRVARRIEQDRVFVATENGKLVFKADIIAETPETIYLEGVYVSEEYRGRNVGSGCLAKLSLDLLNRSQNICLLSNISFSGAHKSFVKAGYRNTGHCTTLFV